MRSSCAAMCSRLVARRGRHTPRRSCRPPQRRRGYSLGAPHVLSAHRGVLAFGRSARAAHSPRKSHRSSARRCRGFSRPGSSARVVPAVNDAHMIGRGSRSSLSCRGGGWGGTSKVWSAAAGGGPRGGGAAGGRDRGDRRGGQRVMTTGASSSDEEYRGTGTGFCTLEEKEMKGAHKCRKLLAGLTAMRGLK